MRLTGWQGAAARQWRLFCAAGAGLAAVIGTVVALASGALAQSGGGSTATPLPALPSVTIVRGTLISPAAANAWYATQAQTATDGLCARYQGNADICPTGGRPRAPEIRELARALRHDPNLIYEYVRNSVDTEFLFGTHKGSLGVIIDKSGTAFDQAQLMVDLLREVPEGGGTGTNAQFRYGTITLTGTQFQQWTGITNAKAACDFLATGGIPATVNSCDAGGTVSSVTMSHVWVEAQIGGTWRFFDPAFKPYEHTKGINDPALVGNALTGNLKTAMGFDSGELAAAAGGTETGVAGTPGLSTIGSVSQSGISTLLNGYGAGLLTRLRQPDMQGASLREVIGGRLIEPAVRPAGGWLQTAPSGYQATATWTGIPDPWRATVKLYSVVQSGQSPTVYVDATFFGDEIYGRRTEIVTVPEGPLGDQTWSPHLLLDGISLNIGAAQPGGLHQKINLQMTANHPFAAASVSGQPADGTYGDATVTKLTDIYSAATLVISWGSTSTGLGSKWGREYTQDRPAYYSVYSPLGEPPEQHSSGDNMRANVAATWLAQFSWSADIHAELADARPILLHTLGVISEDRMIFGVPEVPWEPGQFTAADEKGFETYDQVTVVDLESSFGLVTRDSNVSRRKGAVHAIAATAATLEGSVIAQLFDAPDTASTTARFAWGNNPEAMETPDASAREVYFLTEPTSGGTTRVDVANAFAGLTTYDNGTGPVAAYRKVPLIPQTTVDIFRSRVSGTVSAYAADQWDITVSSEASLGPGHRIGSEYVRAIYSFSQTAGGPSGGTYQANCSGVIRPRRTDSGPLPSDSPSIGSAWFEGFSTGSGSGECDLGGGNVGNVEIVWSTGGEISPTDRVTRTGSIFARFPTLQRGGALIATKYGANDEPIAIAHVLTRYGANTKGGGGPSITQAEQFKPNEAAQSLKDKFVDRSGAQGVDIGSGHAGFASPILASVGSGEFPYRLDRRIELRGGATTVLPMDSFIGTRPRSNAVSNWDVRAEISNSANETMGQSRADAAVPTIVAFIAMQDAWATMDKGARRDITGIMAAKWWSDRLLFNVVTVLKGASAQQFVRLIDNTFVPASGGAGKLEIIGTRAVLRPDFQKQRVANATQKESTLRGWDYSGVTRIEMTNPGGDKQVFGFWTGGKPTIAPADPQNPWGYLDIDHGWRMTSWEFPQGVHLTMEYQPSSLTTTYAGSQSSVPKRVNSSLGFGLDIPLTGEMLTEASEDFLVSCGTLRLSNLEGETTKVVLGPWRQRSLTQRPGGQCRPVAVYAPSDQDVPSLSYTYDTLGRVKEAKDAVAIREPTTRGSHKFFIAEGYRGERQDPLGGRYAVETLRGGRETRHYDELFFVTSPAVPRPPVITRTDGRGRVIERTFPEGDKVKFEYDLVDNPTKFTKCPKTGCGAGQDLVVTATWHATWNKPLSVTDAMGRTTTFSYYESGDGKSLLQTAVRPAPTGGAAQPTYSFWYKPNGLLWKTTDADGVKTENVWSAAGCLTETRLDPDGLNLKKFFACDAVGNTTQAWDARGEALTKVTTTYDLMRRPTAASGPLGVLSETDYDPDGRPTQVRKRLTVAGVHSWQIWNTGYTATGQTAWTEDPSHDVARFEYDGLDRTVKAIAPTGDISTWAYDAAGQLTQMREGVGITCGGGVPACEQVSETYSYTPNGERASLTDARGNTTTFVYDIHDRLLRTVFPDLSWEG
ncbi:MAG TPA: hypothetical protein VEA44_10850, partial [Caulobacter sp.]|nr:hypothetical protein [Caulobacter sp.]